MHLDRIPRRPEMILLAVLAVLCLIGAAHSDEGGVPIAPPPYGVIEPASQFEYQTSFEQGEPGRNAGPVNQTAAGVPGFPVMAIGHQMRLRYSEFDLRFRVVDGGVEKTLYTQPNFRQHCPDGWLPGAITEFDHKGVHYRIGYVVAPSSPQPIDIFSLDMENTSKAPAKGGLRVLFDGAPTVELKDSIVSDRGKPLAYLTPLPEKSGQITRDYGVVDPRTTPYGVWSPAGRTGWYGMPIEYKIKLKEKARVFLVFHGTPGIAGFPPSVWPVPPREIIAEVEGDPNPQRLKVEQPTVLEFDGSDTDGDGYLHIKVQATPESRQPAILNDIFFFPAGTKLDHDKLIRNELTTDASFHLIPGMDRPCQPELATEGKDPTLTALQLDYAPDLMPGEKKHYELRLPAIDRPETMCYGNPYHPYDTGRTWLDPRDSQYPDNKAPYGEDVPPGRDPKDYAIYGPKDRSVWDAQLAAARKTDFEAGLSKARAYWEKALSDAMHLDIPEKSIDDTFKHQIAELALHSLKFGDSPCGTITGGPFFYWDFCYRDASYLSTAMDIAGMHDISALHLNSALTPKSKMPKTRWTLGQWDDPEHDGLFMTREGQFDAMGQTLWATFEHYQLTGDRKWLEANYDAVRRAANWIIRSIGQEKKRIGDPNSAAYGLLPEGLMEGMPWHHAVYFNAWAVYGLEVASEMASDLKMGEDALRFKSEASNLRTALRRSMQKSFMRKNLFMGYVPSSPEKPDDFCGWAISALIRGNKVLSPHDPLVDASWKYRESYASKTGGLMDWPYIHTDWALGYIDRGEPDRCTQLFYTYLSLASGTLDWGEWYTLNKKFTEFDPPVAAAEADSEMPHTSSCADFMLLLRSMLLREVDDELHIAAAAPRKWLSPGEHYGVKNAPSHFGQVDYRVSMTSDGKTVRATVSMNGERKPSRLLVHFRTPGDHGIAKAIVNGKPTESFLGDCVIVTSPGKSTVIEAELKP